ncbi:hypothetical protein JCM19039_1048 [Geomicrobium sp. JCM 19039]|nr:hypothetical protein JCM19039_1048 [Geomicrobium sp. JCM 19039]
MTWFRGSTLVLVITLTLCWLVAGFALGLIISGYGAAFVIGIIALLVSAGFHIAAIEWVEDMK